MMYTVLFLLNQTERFIAIPELLSSLTSCIIQLSDLHFLPLHSGSLLRSVDLFNGPQHLLPPPPLHSAFGLHEVLSENASLQDTPLG